MADPIKLDPYACVDEIPLHRVRANQLGILLSVIAALAAQQYWILILPLAVQLIGRTYGVRYNLFVRVLSPLLPASARTESRELLRFNNLLAVLFLAAALIGAAFGIDALTYISIGMLTAAVVLALCGFCLGCFMYFQYKQFHARRRLR
ncbi:DUF4395 domain-containing protein [Paenibacillus sacheonensis]|uniref:DUF4395 family protein n=1 Tax=Paenibacillus sacheonensis TaxID=742054 RepID=A0A7X5C327_9BACL|nr:DUF4395 domain-containing protein [Paenibacillus sacheonensis]MBM7567102.1 hypothetical protein [Paenibacillus sacheonensis]NBC70969.1 DUF4395 family protein [Paenibacillus sacheonensis]